MMKAAGPVSWKRKAWMAHGKNRSERMPLLWTSYRLGSPKPSEPRFRMIGKDWMSLPR